MIRSRHLSIFVTIALLVTGGLYYMYDNASFTNTMKKATEKLTEIEKFTSPQKPTAEEMTVREQLSQPDENLNLVFVRKFGRVKNLPNKEEMESMSDKEIKNIYHSYLDNTDFRCERKLRMGNAGDGGWEVCDDFQYRPIKPCIVYSFGIDYDFSFDDDVGKVYGCNVYSFDPSMNQASHRRSDKVQFFQLGIRGQGADLSFSVFGSFPNKAWQLKTLTEIKAMLKHENATIDILKIDVEAAEWSALDDALNKGELSKVRQLLIEFHYNHKSTAVRKVLPILKKLEASGFRRFHTHMNPVGPSAADVFPVVRKCCYEVYFANSLFVRNSSSATLSNP